MTERQHDHGWLWGIVIGLFVGSLMDSCSIGHINARLSALESARGAAGQEGR